MKKLLLLAFCIILQSTIFNLQSYAQAPKLMNYQGVARSTGGQTLVNKTISLRLSILSATDITEAIYKEEQLVTTTEFGLFALKIGEGSPVKGSMADVDWGSADHFIAVELDVDNNGHFQLMGTSQLLSVPYAFYAEKAGKAIDLENADQYRDIPFSGTSGQTIRSNGSEWEASSTLFSISGKIGIGSTEPAERLDVNGNINLTLGNEIKIGGERALKLDANRNMMQGEQAGNALTTGVNNNFIGNRAGRVNTTGSNNSFIGYRAGLSNTTGNANMFLGYRAGHFNTVGSNNFYGGLNAGYNSTSGLNNIALGTNAGFNLADGKDNTLVGRDAGFNTTGNRNAFIGKDAGKNNTTGYENTYIGYNAYGADSLNNATAIGANAVVSQDSSIVLGNAANVGIGTSAPSDKLHVKGILKIDSARIEFANTGGGIFIGNGVCDECDSYQNNVVVGHYALRVNTFGGINTAMGNYTLNHNTHGSGNSAFGNGSLGENTWGNFNTAMGFSASGRNETGSYNVALGSSALYNNVSGGNNTAIGRNADVASGNLSNATVVGANATVGCSDCVVLGKTNAKVGIGTTTPADKLHVEGNIRMVDGNQVAGYVPVSDANGTMTWTDPGTITTADDGDWAVSGNNQYSTVSGNVGIGSTTPQEKLHVVGNIRMVDGNQQAGYVMTSDANGTASWQAPTVASIIADADNDTKIQVEESADEDIIRFDLGGVEALMVSQLAGGAYNLYQPGNTSSSILIGNSAGNALSSDGPYNIFIGHTAGFLSASGNGQNIFIGWNSGRDNVSGTGNTFVGSGSGRHSTGHSNIFIGFRAGENETGSNRLYIENSPSSSPLIYGEFENDLVVVNGTLRVNDGTQAAGAVAVSDSLGNITWTDQSKYRIPVGTVQMFMGEEGDVPGGWLLCDGSSFSGATYPELATLLGGTNTPNFEGRFPLGAKPIASFPNPTYDLNDTGGEESVTLTTAQMPSHNHGAGTLQTVYPYKTRENTGTQQNEDGSDSNLFNSQAITGSTANSGSGEAHNNMPPFYVVNFIIKAN